VPKRSIWIRFELQGPPRSLQLESKSNARHRSKCERSSPECENYQSADAPKVHFQKGTWDPAQYDRKSKMKKQTYWDVVTTTQQNNFLSWFWRSILHIVMRLGNYRVTTPTQFTDACDHSLSEAIFCFPEDVLRWVQFEQDDVLQNSKDMVLNFLAKMWGVLNITIIFFNTASNLVPCYSVDQLIFWCFF